MNMEVQLLKTKRGMLKLAQLVHFNGSWPHGRTSKLQSLILALGQGV